MSCNMLCMALCRVKKPLGLALAQVKPRRDVIYQVPFRTGHRLTWLGTKWKYLVNCRTSISPMSRSLRAPIWAACWAWSAACCCLEACRRERDMDCRHWSVPPSAPCLPLADGLLPSTSSPTGTYRSHHTQSGLTRSHPLLRGDTFIVPSAESQSTLFTNDCSMPFAEGCHKHCDTCGELTKHASS